MTTVPPPPTRSRPIGWIVTASALAVTAVALAIAAAVLATEDTPGTSAESSALAACEVLYEVPADGFEIQTDDGELNPDVTRLRVASALGELAWVQDDDYEDLHGSLLDAASVTSDFLGTQPDELRAGIRHARDVCADNGF